MCDAVFHSWEAVCVCTSSTSQDQVSNPEHCNRLVSVVLEMSLLRYIGCCYLSPSFSSTCGNINRFEGNTSIWKPLWLLLLPAFSSVSALMSAWVLPVLLCLLSLIYTHLTTYALHSPLINFLPSRQNVSHSDKSLGPCELAFWVFSVSFPLFTYHYLGPGFSFPEREFPLDPWLFKVPFEGYVCSTIEVQSEISSLYLKHVAFDGVFIL